MSNSIQFYEVLSTDDATICVAGMPPPMGKPGMGPPGMGPPGMGPPGMGPPGMDKGMPMGNWAENKKYKHH